MACQLKTLCSILLTFCCIRNISSHSIVDKRGRRLAMELWNEGFSCQDIETFRLRAEEDLFEQCEEKFEPFEVFIRSCQRGVLQFVKEKEDPCVFDLGQCGSIGDSIGRSAARQICEVRNDNESPVFSSRCVRRIVMRSLESALNNLDDDVNRSCDD